MVMWHPGKGILGLCLVGVLAGLPGCAQRVAVIPEAGETLGNWSLARNYQADGRYELARQHYLLAFAAARTPESQQTLQRELDTLDRMIQAMR